jgi:stearoyl-CoA desaturase (delta-9 desaturase)
VDTDRDPYSVSKGLFYSHIGWIVFHQDPDRIGRVSVEDLKHDQVVGWQAQYYWQLFLIMAYIVPTLIAWIQWDDWRGGLVYGGLLGTSLIQQRTFCINSLAHWVGHQPYQSIKSARDNFIVALITLGEGYHNFHHEFPTDWRNGVRWYDYDPTKWTIWFCSQLGLASDLRRFSANEIKKGWLQEARKRLDRQFQTVCWGVPIEELTVIIWEEYVEQARLGQKVILIGNVVYDIAGFIKEHPGGMALIQSGIGKDATELFNGDLYQHSNAARNFLSSMRVAVIKKSSRSD